VTILSVIGCGDAFGSGGRLQTCFHVDTVGTRFLIDCGVTALIGLKRMNIDSNGIDTIFVSHLHGDHFGGIAFIEREAQIEGTRTRPLTIVGPEGIEKAVQASLDAFFPGATNVSRAFPLEFATYSAGNNCQIGQVTLSAVRTAHTAGTNPHALRIEVGGTVIVYSGDTDWTDDLPGIANGAHLFICEAYTYEKNRRNHMALATLKSHLGRFTCKRVLLTHMSEDMLQRLPLPDFEAAHDGLVIDL
jgi:ribonuclease BN (tRNA processing enzyme)